MYRSSRHFRRQTLFSIAITLIMIALDIAAIAIWVEGVSSPWFIASSAALVIAFAAIALQEAGYTSIAAHLLVVGFVSIGAGTILQFNGDLAFASFVFVPIIIGAGLFFGPATVTGVTLSSLVLPFLVIILNGEPTLVSLSSLVPVYVVITLTAVLVTEQAHWRHKPGNLGQRNMRLEPQIYKYDQMSPEISQIQARLKRGQLIATFQTVTRQIK